MSSKYTIGRSLDVVNPVEIYRVIGRRPSAVWVDAAMKVAEPQPGGHRLSDLVYWRTQAVAGEQIQERPGGTFVVMPDGGSHPVMLRAPQPLQRDTAFTHVQAVREADLVTIDQLVTKGDLVEATARRLNGPPSRPSDRLLPEDHPLVIDEPPEDLAVIAAPPPRRRWHMR